MNRRLLIPLTLVLLAIAGCGGAGAPSESSAPSQAGGAGGEAMSDEGTVRATTSTGYGEGGGDSGGAGPEPMMQIDEGWGELLGADRELGEALSLSAPDCDLARELRGRICDLSERICRIAEDHPDDVDVEARCADGQGRCERAGERLGAECSE